MDDNHIIMKEKDIINRYFICPLETMKMKYKQNPSLNPNNILWNNVVMSFDELISNLRIQSDSFK